MAAFVTVAACASEKPAAVPVASTTIATSTVASTRFLMSGQVLVHPTYTITEDDGSCDAMPALPISERVFVSVADDQGRKVGTASLQDGTWHTDRGCLFRFVAPVDSPAAYFDVQIGDEEPVTISRDEASKRGFAIGYGYN
ncbi:hypothetical protein MWU77_06805 [Rhodococcus sp. F64268]|nr:hypothetical protein [Rhodococcus sp. F64268]